MIRERNFPDRQRLAETLASSVADSLIEALERRPRATLVVSGGSTPRPFFERLRTRKLAWDRVQITLADERWVSAEHPESNERLVRELLLADEAEAAKLVGLKTAHETPEEGAQECAARIEPLRPFDVVVLGMGTDGHTASLFPGSEALQAGLSLDSGQVCLACRPAPPALPRLTLTLPALVSSQRLILHLTGAVKWQVYQEAKSLGPAEELPVRAVLREAPRGVDVYWAP